jgi:hypothetical protein
MGWVTQGRNCYYYRKVWNGRQVRAVYVGAGPLAEAVAAEDAARAAERRGRIARHAAERALAARVEEAAAPAAELLEALLTANLLTAGYHYDHSKWKPIRKK